jgi:signal transduction histidine kinase/ActR/RegA family two-component response regulator
VRKLSLRTKFLLSLLAITAGLTSAALLIVRHTIQNQMRESILEDLQNSVSTYANFARQREESLTRSATLLANLPNVRALMTTQNVPTIQDGAENFWRLSGSDLLLLADRKANVVAVRGSAENIQAAAMERLLKQSLGEGEQQDWWYADGHLYEMRIRPIFFGDPSENNTLGFLAVGYEVNQRVAKELSEVASSHVTFWFGNSELVSTLMPGQQIELQRQMPAKAGNATDVPEEVQLGAERYLITTVKLSTDDTGVYLSVLKSFDKATRFLSELNGVLLALGLVSVLAGSLLVFLISDTFTKPLANLVAGVRALEHGDFTYPLQNSGGDEVAEVTSAFDRMRLVLQKTQTEHKALEHRLRQAHKMEAVGRLAGGVAHDFNNLLTIIRGHGDLLAEAGASEAQCHSIEQIQKAANRAVSLTRQLLAFSRMQVLQPRVLDLNAIVAEMGKMLPRLIGEHIEYAFQPAPKLKTIKADPGQIEQVIMNLAVNARDAMPDGGKLTLRTRNVLLGGDGSPQRPMPPGEYVMLSVTDTGHGMNEETKTHIFEPFFTTKEIGKGTGLGLATVYGVVKQSDGFIWVLSAPGEGSTFEIYLPPCVETRVISDSDSTHRPVAHGSETILVAEDEAGVRELTCRFLRSSGYIVLEAKDGVEALGIATRHSGAIHLVLSDMVMPRMGGAALIERLKTVRPEAKLLLMSGYSEYSSSSTGGADRHRAMLHKPFSHSSLIETVRKVLDTVPDEQPAVVAEHV